MLKKIFILLIECNTMSTLEEWDNQLKFGIGMASIVVLLLASCFGNCRREIPEASSVGKSQHLSAEEYKQLLNKFFEMGKLRLQLTAENFTINPEEFDIESTACAKEGDAGYDDVEGNFVEMIHIKIPSEEHERTCANCCAICLDAYKVDDVVVWSSSPDCRHVFHQECLVEGLSMARHNEAPCPCCREIFCDIQMDRQQTMTPYPNLYHTDRF